MATHRLADDKVRINFQIRKDHKAALEKIAKMEGFRSIGELIRTALKQKYFSDDPLPAGERAKLKKALLLGHEAALSYIENDSESIEQLAAEAEAQYGGSVKVQVSKPSSKAYRKKKA